MKYILFISLLLISCSKNSESNSSNENETLASETEQVSNDYYEIYLLEQLNEPLEGMSLIQWMWRNEWGNFKNASQNYSQVAIAAMLCLQDIVLKDCNFIFPCENQYKSF